MSRHHNYRGEIPNEIKAKPQEYGLNLAPEALVRKAQTLVNTWRQGVAGGGPVELLHVDGTWATKNGPITASESGRGIQQFVQHFNAGKAMPEGVLKPGVGGSEQNFVKDMQRASGFFDAKQAGLTDNDLKTLRGMNPDDNMNGASAAGSYLEHRADTPKLGAHAQSALAKLDKLYKGDTTASENALNQIWNNQIVDGKFGKQSQIAFDHFLDTKGQEFANAPARMRTALNGNLQNRQAAAQSAELYARPPVFAAQPVIAQAPAAPAQIEVPRGKAALTAANALPPLPAQTGAHPPAASLKTMQSSVADVALERPLPAQSTPNPANAAARTAAANAGKGMSQSEAQNFYSGFNYLEPASEIKAPTASAKSAATASAIGGKPTVRKVQTTTIFAGISDPKPF